MLLGGGGGGLAATGESAEVTGDTAPASAGVVAPPYTGEAVVTGETGVTGDESVTGVGGGGGEKIRGAGGGCGTSMGAAVGAETGATVAKHLSQVVWQYPSGASTVGVVMNAA